MINMTTLVYRHGTSCVLCRLIEHRVRVIEHRVLLARLWGGHRTPCGVDIEHDVASWRACGVPTISRLLKIIRLFCRSLLQKAL